MPEQPLPLRPTIRPARLKPGDTIAIISPAAPTPLHPLQKTPGQNAETPFEQGVHLLEQAGYRVQVMPHAQKQWALSAIGKPLPYLAGDDADRLSDLHQAFSDPGVAAILCARGGYGTMRLLSSLDFSLIQQNPKILIGFSDITALNLPVYQQTGLVTFYGPMLTSNLIHQEPESWTQLFAMITGETATGAVLSNPDQAVYTCLQPGVVSAPLTGGNLSLLVALCGTPWQPKTAGHILFIEDWKEKYYSLDRQFQQLRLAGVLDNLAGLLLCDFSEIEPEPNLTLPDLLQDLTRDLTDASGKPIPIGYGFAVGHGNQSGTLPYGIYCRFDSQAGTLTLLESPVS